MIIKRAIYGAIYLVALFYYIIVSAIAVARLCFTGKINPQVIVIDTILKKEISQTVLANSITLTPGTLTIDIDHSNQKLTVSAVTPRPQSMIIPFEKYIKGMFE